MKQPKLSDLKVDTIIARLQSASPLEIYPVSYFQLHTAAYIGEVVKLKWDQIDLENATVSLQASGNTNDRKLTLPPKLVSLLQTLPRRNDFVFTSDDGDPWTVVSFPSEFRLANHFGHIPVRHPLRLR